MKEDDQEYMEGMKMYVSVYTCQHEIVYIELGGRSLWLTSEALYGVGNAFKW